VLALAREHLGLRRAPGLHVRHAEGRAFVAGQSAASWDAIVIDAFVGAVVPRRLITAQALAEVARVAPLALVNVVDDRSQREVRTVAAGLRAAYPRVWTVGGRTGNAVVTGASTALPLDRIAAQLAADPSAARVTRPATVARQTAGWPALEDAH
jgi:spermidine synthase